MELGFLLAIGLSLFNVHSGAVRSVRLIDVLLPAHQSLGFPQQLLDFLVKSPNLVSVADFLHILKLRGHVGPVFPMQSSS